MSDDEQMFSPDPAEEEDRSSPVREDSPVREPSPEPPRPKPIPQADDSGRSEAQMMIDEKKQKDKAKMEDEIREYEEMRKEERETMEKDIAELKEKRIIRRQERLEEERLLNEKRQQEDQKRRLEEEERQRVKNEKEAAKRAAREQQRMEAEERTKNLGKRNFSITKKAGSTSQGDGDEPKHSRELIQTDVSKDEVTKSKEQLEAEKQAILAQRVQPLEIQGLGVDQLKEKARELHQRLVALVGDKYDLENQSKTKNAEMSELAERARQMNKGQKQKMVSGEGGDEEDPMSQKFGGAPPKIQLCSKYERHTDRRNYTERKTVFTGPIFAEETARILPSWEVEGKPNPFEEAAKEAAAEEAAAEAAE